MKNKLEFSSVVVHGGQKHDEVTGAVMPPIVTSSTFAQKEPGVSTGFDYSRSGNPTRMALENMLSELEKGAGALAFSSGMAAIAAVMDLFNPGDHILVTADIYAGTWRLFNHLQKSGTGLEISYVDMLDFNAVRHGIKPNTKMLWLETPSNPTLRITDIRAITAIAKQAGVLTAIDNTFATPYLQQPIIMGVDIVVHSVTKFLNGHSDVVGGAVIASNKLLHNKLAFIQNAVGAVLSPFESAQVLRGIKTLDVRMARHCENALYLARWLENHPKISRVYYPGLESHLQHAMAKKQMRFGFGGVVTIALAAAKEDTIKFMKKCKIFTIANSLGGVESIITHPGTMVHSLLSPSQREKMGIGDNMVRLSVGIESCHDLQHDLDQAL